MLHKETTKAGCKADNQRRGPGGTSNTQSRAKGRECCLCLNVLISRRDALVAEGTKGRMGDDS